MILLHAAASDSVRSPFCQAAASESASASPPLGLAVGDGPAPIGGVLLGASGAPHVPCPILWGERRRLRPLLEHCEEMSVDSALAVVRVGRRSL